jgi:hypothetical protein
MYTPNYGSLHNANYHNFGFNLSGVKFNISNTTFDGTTYSNMVKNGIWFVKEFNKWVNVHGGADGTIGLVDNYGNLWIGKVGLQTFQGGYPINFTRDKEGFGQLPDEVIDAIQKIDVHLGLADPVHIYPIIMRCAEQAMELVQLKNEHSKIKDNVEKLTTKNLELKQNVTDLSNENDKLMDIIHKNRWLIVF